MLLPPPSPVNYHSRLLPILEQLRRFLSQKGEHTCLSSNLAQANPGKKPGIIELYQGARPNCQCHPGQLDYCYRVATVKHGATNGQVGILWQTERRQRPTIIEGSSADFPHRIG
jgi:hypothetical protein